MRPDSKKLCLDYQFQCKDKTCISDVSLCDGIRDCPWGEDKAECGCDVITVSSHWLGQNHFAMCRDLPANIQAKCHRMSFVCPLEKCIPMTYVCNGIFHCKHGVDEVCKTTVSESTITEHFECASGEKVPMEYVNDLIPDCKSGTDEAAYKPYYQPEMSHPAERLTCDSGKNVSFSLHYICQFDLDENGILQYCRNGAHLENCQMCNCFDVPCHIAFHIVCCAIELLTVWKWQMSRHVTHISVLECFVVKGRDIVFHGMKCVMACCIVSMEMMK